MRLLVTGGLGFIGSNFIRRLLRETSDAEVVNLDKMTYAGNPANLRDVEHDRRYAFVRGDIADAAVVKKAIRDCEGVVNFAAESHVDRSIEDPASFLRTDVLGTHVLLEAARAGDVGRFLQVSTDEVYGSIEDGSFTESSPLDPSSPYSATKAAADLLVGAYVRTYGLDAVITRSSNNFGPYQHPEKLIPRLVTNALREIGLPIYGDGMNVRDWLYVEDHCAAIAVVLERGERGRAYNVGGDNERPNLDIAKRILALTGKPETLLRFVADRPGHDRRYSVDSSRVRALGWRPAASFDEALAGTVDWYLRHRAWWEPLVIDHAPRPGGRR